MEALLCKMARIIHKTCEIGKEAIYETRRRGDRKSSMPTLSGIGCWICWHGQSIQTCPNHGKVRPWNWGSVALHGI